jgi:hypothetical protein
LWDSSDPAPFSPKLAKRFRCEITSGVATNAQNLIASRPTDSDPMPLLTTACAGCIRQALQKSAVGGANCHFLLAQRLRAFRILGGLS